MMRRAVSGLTVGRAASTAQHSDEAAKAPDSFMLAGMMALEERPTAAMMQTGAETNSEVGAHTSVHRPPGPTIAWALAGP